MRSKLERWFVALSGAIAVEHRHSAHELRQLNGRGDRAQADVHRDRANLWQNLGERIAEHCAGVAGVRFTAADIELVRWYALIGLRQMLKRMSPAERSLRRRQVDALCQALLSQLSGFELHKIAGLPGLRELLP